ncbi:MAG: ABC transporter permease [Phycisphaerales bacterium]|nr:ABC transporter permease [Phycisphaerales bacterium]
MTVSGDIPARPNLIMRLLARWGGFWMSIFVLIGGLWQIISTSAKWITRSFFTPGVRLGKDAVVAQMVRVGVQSIGIVVVVSGCIGLILAMSMYPALAELGQQNQIPNIVGIAVFREMGPLISAIVLTGFAGASIAAEIGTMVVGEEIEALEAHALNPIRFLVVPRVIATVISLLLLTVLADVTAVISSGLISTLFLGVGTQVYIDNTLAQLGMSDFFSGVVKSLVFGLILASIACYNGLRVTGGAAGVGKATTDTVVQTIVLVIIADLMFTAVFLEVGWT